MPAEEPHQIGLKLFARQQYGPASAQFGLAIQQGEETCERWNDWASAQLGCGRNVRAEWGYRRALHFDSANRAAALNLAALLISQGRLQETIPLLGPHVSSLGENEKAILRNLVIKSGDCGSTTPPQVVNSQLLLDAFLTGIALIPNDDPAMPAALREVNRREGFDSRHYVEQCCALLKNLPLEVQSLALGRLKESSKCEPRLRLVLACHSLALNDPRAALALAWEAMEVRPYDLNVQRVLIQAELAATSEASRGQRPRAGLEEYLADSFCVEPWRYFLVRPNGDVHLCPCSGWLVPPVGNAYRSPALDVWNSPAAQAIRASILDGSFKYCARIHCARIAGRTLPTREAVIKKGIRSFPFISAAPCLAVEAAAPGLEPSDLATAFPVVCPEGPKQLMLAHDTTCNLACPQCRGALHHADKEERERLDRFVEDFLSSGLLKNAQSVRLNDSGEVFVSRSCRTLVKRLKKELYPKLQLELITNGQLCNRKAFDDLDLWRKLSFLNVSIDAATEKTYRVLRPGGDFRRLLANLEFLDATRTREGEKFVLLVRFVVSAFNFREMPAFVQLAKKFHAYVDFHFLRNHGTFPLTEFKKWDIANPAHPDHAEFLNVLEAEQLSDPCVDWGSLGYLHPK